MKNLINTLMLSVLFITLINCSSNKEQLAITQSLKTALSVQGGNDLKTYLVFSSVDCNKCFYNELSVFLNENSCDGVLITLNDENDIVELDDNVIQLLEEHQLSVTSANSQDIIIDLAKYSGIKQSPYIVKCNDRNLEVESLKGS